ncbi:hypothetical protein [Myroides odoratus]|uniref:hypothetical protein n=1 Tax=Myroides odoratus TaxID=256 RepID=UPI0039AEF8C4
MKKLLLTTVLKKKSEGIHSVFIYTESTFLKEIQTSSQASILLDNSVKELTLVYGNVHQSFAVEELTDAKQQTLQLTEDLVIQVRLVNKIQLLDRTNLALGLFSGLLTIGYSLFANSDWREFLFLLGSTIIVLLLFMLLYKHPIHTKHYNLRMFTAISALVLIFILIPMENWSLKTLIGLSTLTVITRFIKDYQRSLHLVYNPFIKP